MPRAPEAIATDHERLQMWRDAARRRVSDATSRVVHVSGCGEAVEYTCWALHKPSAPGPGDDRVTDEAECHAVKASSAGAIGKGSYKEGYWRTGPAASAARSSLP